MAPLLQLKNSSVGLADGAVAFFPGRKAQDPAEWLFVLFHHSRSARPNMITAGSI